MSRPVGEYEQAAESQNNGPRWLAGHPRFARLFRDLKHGFQTSIANGWDFYYRQPIFKRVLILMAGTLCAVIGILFVIFHKKAFDLLREFAESWRQLRAGPFIMFGLIVLISFPPLLGFSMLSSLCGMMYGYWGWLLLAFSTIVGSLVSFLACRYLFQDYAQRLARSNQKFAALTSTMEQDGFTLLWMIRLCPLPYSLSNGALASIPSVSPIKFALATTVTSPKLFMHIFVGDRLVRLGTETDSASRIINILSVLIAVTIGTITAYTIYIKTIERAEHDGAYTELELDGDLEANNPSTSLEHEARDSFDIDEDDFESYEGNYHNKAA